MQLHINNINKISISPIHTGGPSGGPHYYSRKIWIEDLEICVNSELKEALQLNDDPILQIIKNKSRALRELMISADSMLSAIAHHHIQTNPFSDDDIKEMLRISSGLRKIYENNIRR